MSQKAKAQNIFKAMYSNDAFSQWLGIELIEMDVNYCKIQMTIRKEMTNGFDISHGGIVYSFADSAFAFASNSPGRKAVSVETNISHFSALYIGDKITAEAKLIHEGHKLSSYSVLVKNVKAEIVANFKGTVYRKSEEWSI